MRGHRHVLTTTLAGLVLLIASGCSAAEGDGGRAAEPAPQAAATSAAAVEPAAAPVSPVVTHRTLRKRQPISFAEKVQPTSELRRGVRRVSQPGKPGVRVRVVRITMEDGVEVTRKVVKVVIARKPVPRIVLRGTYVPPPPAAPRCDSNYTGDCVPIASDVDCGGGSGNGPEYVYGTVKVVGSDIYDLDADGDGYGCD